MQPKNLRCQQNSGIVWYTVQHILLQNYVISCVFIIIWYMNIIYIYIIYICTHIYKIIYIYIICYILYVIIYNTLCMCYNALCTLYSLNSYFPIPILLNLIALCSSQQIYKKQWYIKKLIQNMKESKMLFQTFFRRRQLNFLLYRQSEELFESVGRQNNNNNLKFQGRHI